MQGRPPAPPFSENPPPLYYSPAEWVYYSDIYQNGSTNSKVRDTFHKIIKQKIELIPTPEVVDEIDTNT